MSPEPPDLAAIHNTLSAYNLAGDRLQIEALAATFLEDGVLVTPTATYRGRAAILQGLGARSHAPGAEGRRPTVVRHHLTTSHMTLTGDDSAQGRTYFIVFSDIGPDHAGHYVDRLSKVGGSWLFAQRDVRLDWMAEASLFPALKAAHEARRAARNP